MADHGKNYKRMTDDDGKEIGMLGPDCGHHCGVITVGHTDSHVGHCNKPCCHDNVGVGGVELPTQFTMQSKGVDPRGIS